MTQTLGMTTVAWELVYDAAQVRFPGWDVAAIGAAVAALGVGVGAYLRRRGVASTIARTAVTSAIIFGVSWALLVGGGLYAQHGQLVSALRGGNFVRVEGVVYDSPTGTRDAPAASWVVEEGKVAHWYRYDRSPLTIGYRRAAPGTGGLHSGSRVRIADVGGRIARIEVEQ